MHHLVLHSKIEKSTFPEDLPATTLLHVETYLVVFLSDFLYFVDWDNIEKTATVTEVSTGNRMKYGRKTTDPRFLFL